MAGTKAARAAVTGGGAAASGAGHSRVTLVTETAITSGASTVTGGHSGVTGTPGPAHASRRLPPSPPNLWPRQDAARHAGPGLTPASPPPCCRERAAMQGAARLEQSHIAAHSTARPGPARRLGRPGKALVQPQHAHPPSRPTPGAGGGTDAAGQPTGPRAAATAAATGWGRAGSGREWPELRGAGLAGHSRGAGRTGTRQENMKIYQRKSR